MNRRSFLALTAGTTGVVGSVADVVSVFSLSEVTATSQRTKPTHRYVLVTTQHLTEQDVEAKSGNASVVDVSTLENPDVRDLVERAVTSTSAEVRTDSIPPELEPTLDRYDFFTGITPGPETHTHFALELFRTDPDSRPHLSFNARVLDESVSLGNPGRIELSTTNRSDHPRTIFAGVHPPFGVLSAHRRRGDDGFVVWPEGSNAWLHLLPIPVGIPAVGTTTPIDSGETIRQQCEIRAGDHRVDAGHYVVSDQLSSRPADIEAAPSEVISWDLRFRLTYL